MSFRKKPKTINPDDLDPSVFYYDEVYDDMKNEEIAEKEDASRSHKTEGSKYIRGLIESAELRKTEKEIRKIKRYAKDREEAEQDGSINQNEVYITSSYKKKLDEIRKLEEKRLKTSCGDERLSRAHEYRTTKDRSRHEDDEARSSCRKTDTNSQTIPPESTTHELKPEELDNSRSKTRDLRNHEDRRRYLQEVLAKRTVGARFNEALDRYKQRKDQASH